MNTLVRLTNYRSAYMFQNNLVPTASANKSFYSHLMGLFAPMVATTQCFLELKDGLW